MNTHESNDLMTLEQLLWTGEPRESLYAELFADDGIALFPMEHGILDKQSILASLGSAPAWESVTFTGARLIPLSSDLRLLVYEANARRSGGNPWRALCSSVYRHQNGRWQMLIHQQTPVPE